MFALKEKRFVYMRPHAFVCFLLVMAVSRHASWCVYFNFRNLYTVNLGM